MSSTSKLQNANWGKGDCRVDFCVWKGFTLEHWQDWGQF
jgi:hypothetical protein